LASLNRSGGPEAHQGRAKPLKTRSWGSRNGPVLVLLHGFMGTGGDWEAVARRAGTGRRIVAIDLPGHGDSLARPPGEYTLAGAASAVFETLDGLSVHSFCLAGYSMGGRVALQMMFSHPRRVAGLALVSAHTGLTDPDSRRGRLRADRAGATALERDFRKFLDDWFAQAFYRTISPEIRAGLTASRRQTGTPSELARALGGLSVGGQPDFSRALCAAAIPRLVMAGEGDAKYADLARSLASRDTGIRTRILPDAGHNLLIQAAPAVANELIRLLDGCT
jgi:2-succinyl-6-hydroxy-2,4-cyclohexadiene-1-carboxylate synthase